MTPARQAPPAQELANTNGTYCCTAVLLYCCTAAAVKHLPRRTEHLLLLLLFEGVSGCRAIALDRLNEDGLGFRV